MIPAHRKKKNDVIRYRWPITLWSVDDGHSARIDLSPGGCGTVPATGACLSVVNGPPLQASPLCGRAADPHPPHRWPGLQVVPGELARVLGLELVPERLGVVVVD